MCVCCAFGDRSSYSDLFAVSDDEEVDFSVKPEYYDPDLDDKDESWVTSKRKGRYSDAVLNCPACFTILCYESQRYGCQLVCLPIEFLEYCVCCLVCISFHWHSGALCCNRKVSYGQSNDFPIAKFKK